jgi:hypothetical protein
MVKIDVNQDLIVELVLPAHVVRMCVKYQVNPIQVMLFALKDELHGRAVLWSAVDQGKCLNCGCDR